MSESLKIAPERSSISQVIEAGAWRISLLAADAAATEPILLAEGMHGGNIARASDLAERPAPADGIFVEQPQVVVGVRTADCAPVIMTSGDRALILHVSRKTLVRGLPENATTYIDPRDVNYIFVGPHIGEFNFVFEEEGILLRNFRERYPRAVHFHKGKIHLSLKRALEQKFGEWGVHPNRIKYDGRDTYTSGDLPSYRRWLDSGRPGQLKQMTTLLWRVR